MGLKKMRILLAIFVVQTITHALIAAIIKPAVVSNAVAGKSTPRNRTLSLSLILKLYAGKCYGFATTIKYEKAGCYPVFKTNMICAGTCPSIVYPKDGSLKDLCKACQARKLTLDKIVFSCWKGEKVKIAWARVASGCQCNRVSCGK